MLIFLSVVGSYAEKKITLISHFSELPENLKTCSSPEKSFTRDLHPYKAILSSGEIKRMELLISAKCDGKEMLQKWVIPVKDCGHIPRLF